MRFKTLIISLFPVLAAASCMDDFISRLPECARKCFDEQSKNTGCAIDDYKCQCTKIRDVTDGSAPCISDSCNSDDQKGTTKIASEMCLDVRHENGTGTSHSAMQSLAGVAGSAFASLTSAMGSEFTSAASAAGDTFTSATAGIGDTYTSTTTVVDDIPTGTTHGTASPTSSTPAAANQVTVGMGIVGAAVVFAFAL
ncbi:hypothetical protein FHL15_002069 [Xylaria flabelliformis]|uniref:CFEM domain-containing protein n=1 Tax=Xylaria flabelliformis TaxID=2512241 RepID=A0A553IAQ2_9PEZI|nr:hypothetical protein FHL15_002069 [Xylaria flabelliformis]